MSFEEALQLLHTAVKYSNIKGQKHIDLTLVPASERERYVKALMVVRKAIESGEHKQDETMQKLGIG